ncbi:MAG: hypothetical protein ABH846_00935 [Patescibacteria group bacterium]
MPKIEDESAKLVELRDANEAKLSASPLSTSRIIDCDAAPFIPGNWSEVEHKPGGQLEFDPGKIILHLDEGQQEGRTIVGNELRSRLADKPVLNACVLDHLLANAALIPESWKYDEQGRTRCIYFWGTIYRGSNDSLCVRYLYWDGGDWVWSYRWLDFGWDVQNPAALLAS